MGKSQLAHIAHRTNQGEMAASLTKDLPVLRSRLPNPNPRSLSWCQPAPAISERTHLPSATPRCRARRLFNTQTEWKRMKNHMTKIRLTTSPPASPANDLTASEQEVLEILQRRGGVAWAWELFRLCGCSPSQLDNLRAKGYITMTRRRPYERPRARV